MIGADEMEWIERLNQAIAYIEEHLKDDIDYEQLGKTACCSAYHFQRMFTYMAGIPLPEYDSFENADKINDTLQKIYDAYELSYKENAEAAPGGFDTPYDSWHLLNLTLVGEDYISIEYNNISYMGGAHPYSYFDGITIDCKTGQEITAAELLGKSSDEILQQVSDEMGMDTVASWDEVDFYLTDSTIVFFYRMPNYWEDVELPIYFTP